MSAEMPDDPLTTRTRVTRLTPNFTAASVTVISPKYSRRTSPGCGGLCIRVILNFLITVFGMLRLCAHCGCLSYESERQVPYKAVTGADLIARRDLTLATPIQYFIALVVLCRFLVQPCQECLYWLTLRVTRWVNSKMGFDLDGHFNRENWSQLSVSQMQVGRRCAF